MKIGIPKEIKQDEFRVGATPETVHALVEAGHSAHVQTQAGAKIGFNDESYPSVPLLDISTSSTDTRSASENT